MIKEVVAEAIRKIEEKKNQVGAMPAFVALTDSDQSDILHQFEQEKEELKKTNTLDAITYRQEQFEDEVFQQIIANLLSSRNVSEGEPGNAVAEPATQDYNPPKAQQRPIVKKDHLKVSYHQPVVSSEQDVEQYINSVRDALLAESRKGNTVQI